MKHVPVLLSLCLLLCGCAQRQNGIVNVSSLTPLSETAQVQTLYLPDSTAEAKTHGAVKAFAPGADNAYGLLEMGKNILILSGTDTTTLTLLSGTELSVLAQAELDLFLPLDDPSLSVTEESIGFYDSASRQIRILDQKLKITEILTAPGQLVGSPILSADRSTVYYCSVNAVLAWDLNVNIHRTLKQLPCGQHTLSGLYQNGSVLQCRTSEGDNLFLSTQNGILLHTFPSHIRLSGQEGSFFAEIPEAGFRQFLFGDRQNAVRSLSPDRPAALCCFWEAEYAAIAAGRPENGCTPLDVYDLESGQRRASVTFSGNQIPISLIGASDGLVYILSFDPEYDRQVLYRWDPQPLKDHRIYTAPYYERKHPDIQGLAQCQEYADTLSEKYGIRIRIWKEAVSQEPRDYRLEPEHRVNILQRELQNLDRWLSQYPVHMLRDSASHFSTLSICIVRSLSPLTDSTAMANPTGIHFLDGTDAYVVVAIGEYAEGSLYHELFHVMETHIWGNSIAFDQWNSVNPSGFHYDYNYEKNARRNAGVYLRHDTRAFVDTYAMSFPKEDRARIMEYAMLPGNRELFQTPVMQQKLKLLCAGIREAYRLKNREEPLLWEQYLE